MQILIGCAKDMTTTGVAVRPLSTPQYLNEARHHALQMMGFDKGTLQKMLGISDKLADEVYRRYQTFLDEDNKPLAAIAAYHGVVFKNMQLESFGKADFDYAQSHLWITSFLYGLLRPLDGIKPYRMEGKVKLPQNGGSMFEYWRSRLTDGLIGSIRADGGTLVDLASSEMRLLFDWRKVEENARVVKPEFLVAKGGKVSMPSVWAKKCRGAMVAWILRNRLGKAEDIIGFSSDGFIYKGDDGRGNSPVFVAEK